MSLIVITGLAMEARIAIATDASMIVGAGRPDRLMADLEAAIACGARRLLSFGVAGALSPRLQAGDLVVAHGVRDGARRRACDAAWSMAMSERLLGSSLCADDEEIPGRRGDAEQQLSHGLFRFGGGAGGWRPITAGDRFAPAEIAGVDAPIADAASKTALFAATGAAAVDMESAIVARAAQRHGLPFAILRVIADPAHRPLPSAALVAMRADGEVDLAAVVSALVRDPTQLPGLLRLAVDSRAAFSSLARARAILGPDFASVEPHEALTREDGASSTWWGPSQLAPYPEPQTSTGV